ncbi:MAG: HypC/HybG/HupF family hydrogenase formation chaperone [Actinomycetota bacterium]|jgi:hydrogenase expression/formation protein HypC|nr:HypC/HybG/HupF family hydrogenase formation chaperone [Actinomycetota bacterium]
MCLSVPGRVIELDADAPEQVALVDVVGIPRRVNLGMLDGGERVSPGDWILIHMGCALEKIDEAEASRLLGSPTRR